MKFDTKDKLGHFELINLLNQLGKDQGFKTPEEWDDVLHDYCTHICHRGGKY